MPPILAQTRIPLDLHERENIAAALNRWLRMSLPDALWIGLQAFIDCLTHRWRRLGFAMQAQLQSQWCWAAHSASVSHYYDTLSTWTQCAMVNAELGQTTCCVDGSTAACNRPWYLEKALTRTGNLASWSAGTASMSQVQVEILNGRPVGARIQWSGGGGHFVAIVGYRCDSVGYFDVRDPIFGSSDVPVATFTSSYQSKGSWSHTYYTEA